MDKAFYFIEKNIRGVIDHTSTLCSQKVMSGREVEE